MPAAIIGIAHEFRSGTIKIGIRGQKRKIEETLGVTEVAGFQGLVYKLEGYADVSGIEVPAAFNNRSRTDVNSGGVGVAARISRVDMAIFADVTRLSQRVGPSTGNNPPSDEWGTSGITGGSTAQFPLFNERLLATLDLRYGKLSGDANRLNPPHSGLGSDERVLSGSANMRLLPGLNGWEASLTLAGSSTRRELVDSIAAAFSDIEASTPHVSIEIGRSIEQSLFFTLAAATSWYGGNGIFSSSTGRGTVFRTLVAPQLDLETSNIRSQGFGASVSWQYRPATKFWISANSESLSASGAIDGAFSQAERRSNRLSAGVTLGST